MSDRSRGILVIAVLANGKKCEAVKSDWEKTFQSVKINTTFILTIQIGCNLSAKIKT